MLIHFFQVGARAFMQTSRRRWPSPEERGAIYLLMMALQRDFLLFFSSGGDVSFLSPEDST